jgi:hypothetical protein
MQSELLATHFACCFRQDNIIFSIKLLRNNNIRFLNKLDIKNKNIRKKTKKIIVMLKSL